MNPSVLRLALTAAALLPAATRAQSYAWNDITPANATACYDVAPSRATSGALVLYASCRTGLLRSGDDGATWALVRRGVVRFAVPYRDADRAYAVAGDTLLVTGDGGRSWTARRSPVALGRVSRVEVSPFDPDHLLLVLYRDGALVTSGDGGATLDVVSYPRESHHGNEVNAVPSAKERGVVYAHVYENPLGDFSKAIYGMPTWGGAGRPGVRTPYDPRPCRACLATDTTGALYVDGGRRRSRDGGRTWEAILAGPTPLAVVATSSSNAVAFGAAGAAFGEGAFYLSGDDGRTWRPVTGPAAPTSGAFVDAAFRLDPRDSTLYTASAGRLLALRRLTETTADKPAGPRALALGVYPNPARGPVDVRYTLDRSGPVRLTVHDALGRTVAVVADGARPAGAHDAAFDASALVLGLYLLRLSVSDRTLTRTMTVAQ